MASIILSFVGSQDPFAKTETEGSIVTLVKHLLQEACVIKRVMLLPTSGTVQNAIDTQEWLESEPVNLTSDAVELIAVDDGLSHDPVNLLLAVQAARLGIEKAQAWLDLGDVLEFNSSSGTPVMKGSWSVLQAAGYAANSRVWQVRNPKEMQSGQRHVFQTNVDTLRYEFDLSVLKQQIADYDYGGAIAVLNASSLKRPATVALLQYGRCRLSLDFERANDYLKPYRASYAQLLQEVGALSAQGLQNRLKQVFKGNQQQRRELEATYSKALLQEAYFKAQIRLKRREYSDFLVDSFRLLESIPKHLVQHQIGLPVPTRQSEFEYCWRQLIAFDQGGLYRHLQAFRFPNGNGLELNKFMSRYLLMEILRYFEEYQDILPAIERLNEYCDQRNEYVHGFKGISEIEGQHQLTADLRNVLLKAASIPSENPFDRLNQQIIQLLNTALRQSFNAALH